MKDNQLEMFTEQEVKELVTISRIVFVTLGFVTGIAFTLISLAIAGVFNS